jgi:lipopolysaccharide cholinephosphotransferase
MKKITSEEIKKIQLEILQAFHDFCQENNIMYSLGGGTLLGAIRHNGYIPWDDDIDVYMRRDDYREFIKKFPSVYKGRFKLASLETDPKWSRPYGKLYDDKTILAEAQSKNEELLGINIDIFPVDAVPSSHSTWLSYNKKRKALLTLLFAKTSAPMRKDRSLKKNLSISFLKGILYFVSARRLGKMADKYAQKYNGKENEFLFTTVMGWRIVKPYKTEAFSEVVLHQFEDREYFIMKGYDECLSNLYGDYMKLPPKNKRYMHHYLDAYWK